MGKHVKMGMREVRELLEGGDSPYYFCPKTMKFFGQKLSDFKLYRTNSGALYLYSTVAWKGVNVQHMPGGFSTIRRVQPVDVLTWNLAHVSAEETAAVRAEMR